MSPRMEAIVAWVRSGCREHNNSRMDNLGARSLLGTFAEVFPRRFFFAIAIKGGIGATTSPVTTSGAGTTSTSSLGFECSARITAAFGLKHSVGSLAAMAVTGGRTAAQQNR
jgi:hypothetical protein